MKCSFIFTIFLWSFVTILTPIQTDSTELWSDKLRKDLLLNYDKMSRPSQHLNATSVGLDLNILHVDLDEMNSIMIVDAWMKMFWIDEKLKWNDSDYGGISQLKFAHDEIWEPDIHLYNSAFGYDIEHYGNVHKLVNEFGGVLWVPPAKFKAYCEINLRLWPFDTQECYLKFGSWTWAATGSEIDLQNTSDEPEVEIQVKNSEWKLIGVATMRHETKYYNINTKEPFHSVEFRFKLQRQSLAYKAIVITPSTVIILLSLATFWLPPNSIGKIIMNSFLLLIICELLLSFNNKLPAMADHTPLIVSFYSDCFIMVTFSILISIIVINIARYSNKKMTLHWFIRQLLDSKFARILCIGVSCPNTQTIGDNSSVTTREETGEELLEAENNIHGDHTNEESEWFLLAVFIDRIMFCLYAIIFIILATVYI